MPRLRKLLRAAKPKAAIRSGHTWVGKEAFGCFSTSPMRSKIPCDTFNAARGISALIIRSVSPADTTRGAASQTTRKTGGTFRRAAIRSRQRVLGESAAEFIRILLGRPPEAQSWSVLVHYTVPSFALSWQQLRCRTQQPQAAHENRCLFFYCHRL